jgi:hypothetical protein
MTGNSVLHTQELRKLLDDPENYVRTNYENTLFGQSIGDWGLQADGM